MLIHVTISDEHRAYLIRTQLVGPAVINFALSASIAWYLYHEAPYILVWHPRGIVTDAVISLFVISFLTCLITTPWVKLAVTYGKVSPLQWRRADHSWLGQLPSSLLLRSMVFGLLGAVVGGLILISGLMVLRIPGMWLAQLVVFKGIYSAVIAVIVSQLVALCALADAGTAT